MKENEKNDGNEKIIIINDNDGNNNNSILSSLYLESNINEEENNIMENNIALKRKNTYIIDINNFRRKNSIFNLNINKQDDFSQIIIARLDEIQKNTKKTFDNLINNYNICYNEYKTIISEHLKNKEKNISKVIKGAPNNNNNFLQYAVHNIFLKIDNCLEIYDNIICNIEDNFELLNKFLKKGDLMNGRNTVENFLIKNSEDIFNCSLLSKFNYEEINTLNISKYKYYNMFLQYLNAENKNEFIKSYTIEKDNVTEGINIIKEIHGLKNLLIKDIDGDNLVNILSIISKKKNLETIELKNYNIDKNKIKNFKEVINVKNVKMKNSRVIPLKIFVSNNKCLLNLSLEKIDMSNLGFQTLMDVLYKNENILKNLEYLSLSGNVISSIEAEKEDNQNYFKIFEKLKILDLSKNDIYQFFMPFEKFPELKLLDLSSNSIPTSLMMEDVIENQKNKIVLFNNNIFITNCSINNNKYNQYLIKNLQKLDCDLKVLNLCFTYNIKNQKYLETLKLSPTIKISLIKLDLSYCGLRTNTIINFLKNNFGLFSLQKLNLCYNNIESDFFKQLLSDEIVLENINVLDLSENEISCQNYENHEFLVKFVLKYINLKSIKLLNTSFLKFWNFNISSEIDEEFKYKKLYKKLKENIITNKRTFKLFVFKGGNFIEQEYSFLFKVIDKK